MANIDYQAELELVNDAISKVLRGGVDVTYDGHRVVKSDLDRLRAHRNSLISEITKQERGGIRIRRGVPL